MTYKNFQFFEQNGDGLYWRCCEVKGCDGVVCIGISRTKCFDHSGVTRQDLNTKRTLIILSDQERLY